MNYYFIFIFFLLQAVLVLQKSASKENCENITTVGLKMECKLHEISAGSRWREMLLLMVSWICVVLTAAEFIIKRVSHIYTLLLVVGKYLSHANACTFFQFLFY